MPITPDSSVQAAFDAGSGIRRDMVNFDFASGVVGWQSGEDIITWNSVDYYGMGALVAVSEIRTSQLIEENKVSVTLRAKSELMPDIIAGIESETYHRRAANILVGILDPDDISVVLGAQVIFHGAIDQIVHTESQDGEYSLSIQLVDRYREIRNNNHRLRTSYDQTLISAGDTFLQHAASVPNELIEWGGGTEQKGARIKGFLAKWRAHRVSAGKKILFPGLEL